MGSQCEVFAMSLYRSARGRVARTQGASANGKGDDPVPTALKPSVLRINHKLCDAAIHSRTRELRSRHGGRFCERARSQRFFQVDDRNGKITGPRDNW
ncbi:hypothetical protein AZ78_3326 [Lysobacter capsici AZ78]|uniref:Uncharacterized protein n=1 Tax=Lysobacter capsici AZ78 TaxID=1444315 RepID=A0A108UB04_9GAMM|nr:hypothetical protein AZ78_3326 [Lysobacter capsici AZ78]